MTHPGAIFAPKGYSRKAADPKIASVVGEVCQAKCKSVTDNAYQFTEQRSNRKSVPKRPEERGGGGWGRVRADPGVPDHYQQVRHTSNGVSHVTGNYGWQAYRNERNNYN
jgi:hypothetical protein